MDDVLGEEGNQQHFLNRQVLQSVYLEVPVVAGVGGMEERK